MKVVQQLARRSLQGSVSRARLSCSALRFQSTAAANSADASSSSASPWASYEMGPPDPIIGLNEAYQKDDFPGKVIVGVGAYRDDLGKPHVLPCVRAAEQKLMDQKLDMEYSGIVSIKRKNKSYIVDRSRSVARVDRDELGTRLSEDEASCYTFFI